ncbi:MAG: SMC-Scp complex subunit ScpB [Bacilli bacterium]|nr:SMC-Scp complex subunit ScpB [Bacilli bacterium]MDD4282836.1 SMC-Scp complex subunit ScpB [Bacilli bacterium]MDD4719210.1 SMC-Scp complex subunit ScpB [Bacilli bacterium]
MNLLAALEGLLFLCGDDGLQRDEIATILEISPEEVEGLTNVLLENYKGDSRGLQLEKYGNVYKLVTKSLYNEFYEKLVELDENKPLTNAALEVLAIIAYNQPVTRTMVDELRGVSSSHMVRKLQARELICEIGRSDLPGRPFLYKTTDKFLDILGIKSLDELPKVNPVEESEIVESELFQSKYIENK